MQEYFAAQFIYLDSKAKQNSILDRLSNHSNIEKFINVLDLYYDMDYRTFRNVIEKSLLEEYSKHSEINYNKIYKGVSKKSIQTRREISFLTTSLIFKSIREKYGSHPFDSERLTKMLDGYREKHNLDEKSFSGILVSPTLLKDQFTIHYENSKNVLLKLLASKKSQLVRTIPVEKIRENILDFTYDYEDEFILKEINDSQTEIFNSKAKFDIINQLIIATKSYPIIIENDVAIKTLIEINESLDSEKEDDFLVNGI